MARNIASRIKYQVTLAVQRTMHVGGANEETAVDLALAINGQGQVYIPGTSLAGALRAWSEQVDTALTQKLWGYQSRNGEDEGNASLMLIEDATVTLKGEAMRPYQMEVRNGIGIDRALGTTVENFQFTRAVIPRGAAFTLELSLEIPQSFVSHTEQVTQHIDRMLKALDDGKIRFGAAKSRGLGLVKITKCYRQAQKLDRFKDILQALTYEDWESHQAYKAAADSLEQITIHIHWHPVGPMMVKSDQAGSAIDILPLMGQRYDQSLDEQQNPNYSFVLPGSSIKGALRSQAERIIRTVLAPQRDSSCESEIVHQREQFVKDLDVSLVGTLFGSVGRSIDAAEKPDDAEKVDIPALPGMAALMVDDCYSTSTFSADRVKAWQNAQCLDNEHCNADLQQAFHVAVDRWTGGAADGFLYSNLEPFNLKWEPIQLSLSLPRLGEARDQSLALLYLLLRDFSQSRIPLGYGVNRGMGAVAVTGFSIERANPESASSLTELQPNFCAAANCQTFEQLSQAWSNWISNSLKP